MALKIRLWRQGCTNNACYRIVVADRSSPRDGKYVEAIGHYNPHVGQGKQQCVLNAEKLQYWLSLGAEMSETVISLAKKEAPEVLKKRSEQKYAQKVQKAAKKRAA